MSEASRTAINPDHAGPAVGIWQAVYDAVGDGICLVDRAGVVLRANRALGELLGRPPCEFVGRGCEPLLREVFGPAAAAPLVRALAMGGRASAELPAGGRCLRVTVAPVPGDAGGAHAVLVWADLTERRRGEQALRAEQAFRRALGECLLAGVMAADAEGRLTYVSSSFCRMVGWSEEELLGERPPYVFWPPEETEKIRSELCEAVARGFPPDGLALRFRRRNGERFGVMMTLAPMGEAGWLAVAYDQSDQRRAEAERAQLLREQAQLADRLGLLLESTAEGIYGVDGDGRCTFINRSAARMLGYPPSELIGQPLHTLIHHSRADGTPNPEECCALCHPSAEGQLRRRRGEALWRRDGGWFPVEYTAFPVVREGGPGGAVVAFLDLTDRERLEEQLRHAQKMEAVGRLAGGVAHDFNNLLTVINGCSELLLAQLRPGDSAMELVEEVRKAGERAASLTQQLLIFSRRQVVVPHILDLNAVVADAEKMLCRLIGEDIECVVQAGARAGLVKMDRGQIHQILLNLAVNSRDAMPQGGRLTIQTADAELNAAFARTHLDVRPGPYVLLTVTDTGHGMTEEVQAHLFEPFFTTKEIGKGTGLGLSTVYGIVKQAGGHIEVESEPGRGTTFRVYLPRAVERLPEPDSERVPMRTPCGPATILVVEDEDLVRGLVRMVLRWNGYTVLEARGGAEALTLCEQHVSKIDLLVTDVIMPQMNGRELAERLRKLKPGLRVLFISGYTGEALSDLDLQEAGGNFLQKPFTPDVIARKVGEMLGNG